MELTTKKRIAKEVLLLLSSVVLALFTFMMVYPYNWYCSSKSDEVQKHISALTIQSDSLISQYNSKLKQQQWFYDANLKESGKVVEFNYLELWNRLETLYNSDSIEYKYNNVWNKGLIEIFEKIGFQNSQEFNHFIKTNIFTQDDIDNKLKSDEINSEVSKLKYNKQKWLNKKLSFDKQMWFTLYAF
jgi:hypothetical protein